jgi:NAD(P)H-dependent flavin oxidoreductase YrpB (nitropropane dioxygenase family)
MGTAGGYTLTAAVSNAGGLGMLGATFLWPDELRAWIRKTRELTDKPFGVDILLPAAIPKDFDLDKLKDYIPPEHTAFIQKMARDFGVEGAKMKEWPISEEFGRSQFQVVKEEKVPFFALGLGTPDWLIPEAHEAGIKIVSLVGNVRNAVKIKKMGADIIIAQGHDAGGHTGRVGTFALVPQVVDAVAPTPVVAAGGIADGRGLVAALALGAIGAWCGTAFLATHECFVDFIELGMINKATIDAYYSKLIESDEEAEQITRIYSGKTTRAFKNKLDEAWEKSGLKTLPMPLQSMLMADLVQGMMEKGETEYFPMFAGQVSGLIKKVRSTQEVMDDIIGGAVKILGEEFPAGLTVKA